MRRLAILAAAVLVVVMVIAAACSGGDDGRDDGGDVVADLTQSVEVGGVTVEATWLAEGADAPDADLSAYPAEDFIALDVTLDTHSGDLTSIDMAQAAEMTGGGPAVEPAAWVSVSDDSHHREGVLVFPRSGVSAPAVLTLDVSGETVTLAWQEAP